MKAITRVLFIALLGTSAAYAEDTAKSNDTSKTKTTDTSKTGAAKEKLTANELQVMAHYHAVDQFEIDAGKLAQKQAGNQAVKSYGEMLVKDHTDFDKQMTALAKKTGQSIPAYKPTEAEKTAQADDKKQLAALKKMKGAEFDTTYLNMMVAGHDRELASIDTRMAEVQNTQLQDLLHALKPQLQHHADAARELQKNAPAASNTTNPPSPGTSKSASATPSQPQQKPNK